MFVTGRAGDDFHGHPLCLNEVDPVVVKRHGENEMVSTDKFKIDHEKKCITQKCKDSTVKKLKSKKYKFVKHVTKVTENSLGQTVTTRLIKDILKHYLNTLAF